MRENVTSHGWVDKNMEFLKKSLPKMEYKLMIRFGSLLIGIVHVYERIH